MNARHTAGPWQRGHMGDAERAWIGPVDRDHMPFPVAHIDRNERDNWEANAALIATAPELLSALLAIVQAADDVNTYTKGGVMAQAMMDPAELRTRGNTALEAGRAAIAKATPEQKIAERKVRG